MLTALGVLGGAVIVEFQKSKAILHRCNIDVVRTSSSQSSRPSRTGTHPRITLTDLSDLAKAAELILEVAFDGASVKNNWIQFSDQGSERFKHMHSRRQLANVQPAAGASHV
jgi:hypothetical protein